MTGISILGAGNIGEVHLGNLLSLRGCAVPGIFDTNREELDRVSRTFGVRAYSCADEIFADASCDAIVIATPSSTHKELCLRALESGKHIFVEKPLAGTLEDAIEICRSAARFPQAVQVGSCERFNAQYLEAKRAVQSGRLGNVRVIHSSRIAPCHLSDPAWELGVFDTAVHNLDLILWLMGQAPRSVLAKAVRVYNDTPTADSATTVLTFDDGAMAVDHIAWIRERAHPLSHCARSRMFMQGDAACLELDLNDRPSSIIADDRVEKIDSVILGGPEYYGCLKLQFEYFLRAVEEGAPVMAPLADALLTQRVVAAAVKSLAAEREVRL